MTDKPLSCDGCGACCMEMNGPPGYIAVVLNPDGWPRDTGDHERVANLPERAMALLLDYIDGRDGWNDRPCCWLDLVTKRCRFYEHRPGICRNKMDVGSAECLDWRKEYIHLDTAH